jgi:uncharacterized protein (TIGR02147 family)
MRSIFVSTMIYEHTSYRTFLKEELAVRTKKNPKYSLRAMAMQLGFSHSTLSLVMKGALNLSLESARKIASRLNLSTAETEYLCLLIQFDGAQDPEVRESILKRLKSINPKVIQSHDLSVFKQRSEWYYTAIMGMAELPNNQMTPTQISKRLGISKIEAEVAVDRLLRLELLEKDNSGRLVPVRDRLLIQSDATSNEALRKFYRQMFQKVSEALENQTSKERISGFETIPLASEAINEAQEITEKYFQEMIALGEKYPKQKHVYHLIVHFFNLTHGKE